MSTTPLDTAEVLACLDDAIGEHAFKLAVAVLLISTDQNERRNYVECVASDASAANGEGR